MAIHGGVLITQSIKEARRKPCLFTKGEYMKFYGNGVVWNTDTDSALCKFIDGEFETTDSIIIDKLITKGYLGHLAGVEKSPMIEVPVEEVSEPTNKESLTVEVPKAVKATPASAKPAQVKKAVKK